MLTYLKRLSAKRRRAAFTLVEVIVAVTIITLVTTGAITVFIMGLKAYHEEAIKNELNLDLEIAMENIRQDLRLSSACLGGAMAFYPPGSNVYTAISFPIASVDADGLLARDTNTVARKITWDQTVIYHVKKGTPDQLVRTVYQRDPDVTPVPLPQQLQDQLVDVVKNHATTGAALQGEIYRSRVIFNNLVDIKFRALPCYYDGYSTNIGREGAFNFGSIVLTQEHNWVEFEFVATNANASNVWLGIDRIRLSQSQSDREGEFYSSTNGYEIYDWDFGYFQMSNTAGTVAEVSNMTHVMGFNWSGGHQLTFKPNNAGDRIGFNVYNDMWLDTDFDNYGGGQYGNRSAVVSNSYVSASKGTTWASYHVSYMSETNYWQGVEGTNYAVNIVGENYLGVPSYSLITYSGKRCRIAFAGPSSVYTNKSLAMYNVTISEVSGSNAVLLTFSDSAVANPKVMAPGAGTVRILAGAGQVWSDWCDAEIEKEKSYQVTWRVLADTNMSYMGFWPTSISNISYWGAAPGAVMGTTCILAVTEIEVSYPEIAGFQSGIFDTGITNPAYTKMKWRALEKNGVGSDFNDVGGNVIGDLRMKVGSANDATMTADADWLRDHVTVFMFEIGLGTFWEGDEPFDEIEEVDISGLNPGRFVQYGVRFDSHDDPAGINGYMYSAELHDVLVEWIGATGAVDLTLSLARGPDYGGVYKAYVNGQELVKGLRVDLQIFNTSIPLGRDYTVKGELHVIPLNTGK